MKKLRVGILGATGSVGQRFISLLENHPWFTVTAVVASEKSAGKRYSEAVSWKMPTPIPKQIEALIVQTTQTILPCDVLFSGLDASVAGETEERYAKAGYPVISNSKNHRMDPDVPLLIPEVNSHDVDMIPNQRKNRGFTTGFIVTNPNCSVVGLTMALKPLHEAFGVTKVHVVTMQALSGAGFPGVPSMDILDNVIPFIGGEEEKLETEPQKILGSHFTISAQCNRVAVVDGHTEAVSVKLSKKTSVEEIKMALSQFMSEPQKLKLPSAPARPIVIHEIEGRPQPRLDRDLGNGMTISVGRIRKCNLLDYKFVVLSHNTIRGAAGAAILNAELLYKKGYISAGKRKLSSALLDSPLFSPLTSSSEFLCDC